MPLVPVEQPVDLSAEPTCPCCTSCICSGCQLRPSRSPLSPLLPVQHVARPTPPGRSPSRRSSRRRQNTTGRWFVVVCQTWQRFPDLRPLSTDFPPDLPARRSTRRQTRSARRRNIFSTRSARRWPDPNTPQIPSRG